MCLAWLDLDSTEEGRDGEISESDGTEEGRDGEIS